MGRVVPKIRQWLRERRVSHEDILRLYLERIFGESLVAFTNAEQAWARLADRAELDRFLRSLDPTRLQDVISSLEIYEAEFAPHHVVPASIVLLNLVPDIPERRQGLFGLSTELVVSRVVYRLIRSLNEPAVIESAVREILPQLTSLSAKEELITLVGYREHAGHKLVSETAAKYFEQEWRNQIRLATTEQLAKEKQILRIVLMARRDREHDEPVLQIPDSPEVTLALLRSAYNELRSQSIESRAVRQSRRLSWDVLIEVFGHEDTLRQRIESLKATNPKGVDDLLDLARQYLDSWRPDELDRE